MKTATEVSKGGRRGWIAGAVVIAFVILFLVYAVFSLNELAGRDETSTGPLAVRTDLMRDRDCHVANATIMGRCTADEVAALQREHGAPR